MQTGNPSVRPFHFSRDTRVTVVLPADFDNPSSVFKTLEGLTGAVVCESSSMPGYFHVRFDKVEQLPAHPLFLVPWSYLQQEVTNAPG